MAPSIFDKISNHEIFFKKFTFFLHKRTEQEDPNEGDKSLH